MTDIRFLSPANVLRLHEHAIARFGGASGVRDHAMLESAVAMAQATFDGQYLHEGLAGMAAAYFYHICQAHPFIDGNKRAAAAAALAFIQLNGYRVKATDRELTEIGLAVAAGAMSKDEVTARMRKLIDTPI